MIGQRRVAGIVVAAGQSRRMGFDKLFYPIGGVEVLRLSVAALAASPCIYELVVVAGENLARVEELFRLHPAAKPLAIVPGGACRAASVAAGVAACPQAELVAIHDGARPFVSEAVIARAVEAAATTGAAAPAVPVKDTIKQVQGALVAGTPPRDALRAVQTPQVFARGAFLQALAAVSPQDYPTLTDDCMVMERAGLPVMLVEGDEMNTKITTEQDLPPQPGAALPRVGHGYDVHRLEEGRRLILGGVHIPYEKGLQGHSDADVLLHAVADALLGAAAQGDIGRHFPDTDEQYKGADSLALLRRVAGLVRAEGYATGNVDATILCQQPKLAGHIPAMRANIATALGVQEAAVSVKATTEERLGFTGAGQGIAAHAVVLLYKA